MRHYLLLFIFLFFSCSERKAGPRDLRPEALVEWEYELAEIIRKDIFPPPQVSRIFAYAHIAAYEAMLPAYPDHPTFVGDLKGLEELPVPQDKEGFDPELAALTAYLRTARSMVYNEEAVDQFQQRWTDSLSTVIADADVVGNSVEFGERMARAVIQWASSDMFKETRSMMRYSPLGEEYAWEPTPPAFASAFEPHWDLVRPFVVDSTMISRQLPVPEFRKDPGSPFHNEALAVYTAVNELNDSLERIAWYWDDNPNTLLQTGHVMIKVQKHSPSSHWMLLAGKESLAAGHDAPYTARTLALTAIAMHDAFIHCWHGKYTYNVIRPITYINRYIDPDWRTVIQTPPFPECPSGHSSVSRAAAVVLSYRIDDEHAFTDITEKQFGLGERSFPSFIAAAEEAKMSRLYGGIHFPFGNEIGAAMGDTIGKAIIHRVDP